VAYAGRFTLAKLNSDEVPQIAGQLSQMFSVRSIPFCVMFSQGQPVDGFVGALPESQIREFLDKHVPPAGEDEAQALPADDAGDAFDPALDDPAGQIDALRQAAEAAPDNDDARFDYVKALLLAGHTDDAKVAFAPVIAKAQGVRRLDSLARLMDAIDFAHERGPRALAEMDGKIAANKRDFDARFARARVLMAQQQWTESMDELLEILMRDKAWSEDLARKTYIAVLDIIETPKPKVAEGQIPPDDPLVATYRRRLSSVVLS